MPRQISFHIAAKNIFISYPDCTLSKEEALDQLLRLPYKTKPVYIRVAREEHKGGTHQLRCLLQFRGTFVVENARYFDLPHPNLPHAFHPNIRGAKSSHEVREHMSMVGDMVDSGKFLPDGRLTFSTVKELYAAAFAMENEESALQVFRDNNPKYFVLNYVRIKSKIEKNFRKPPSPYEPRFSKFTNLPPALIEWANKNIHPPQTRPDRPMSIIIEGPTRIGKTEWARSLGPHNYISGYIDFGIYSNEVYYNIIDLVPPKLLVKNCWRELIGSKHDWRGKVKYGRRKMIEGGVPSIVLCNPGREDSYKEYLDHPRREELRKWTLANAEFVFLSDKLYHSDDVQATSSFSQNLQMEEV